MVARRTCELLARRLRKERLTTVRRWLEEALADPASAWDHRRGPVDGEMTPRASARATRGAVTKMKTKERVPERDAERPRSLAQRLYAEMRDVGGSCAFAGASAGRRRRPAGERGAHRSESAGRGVARVCAPSTNSSPRANRRALGVGGGAGSREATCSRRERAMTRASNAGVKTTGASKAGVGHGALPTRGTPGARRAVRGGRVGGGHRRAGTWTWRRGRHRRHLVGGANASPAARVMRIAPSAQKEYRARAMFQSDFAVVRALRVRAGASSRPPPEGGVGVLSGRGPPTTLVVAAFASSARAGGERDVRAERGDGAQRLLGALLVAEFVGHAPGDDDASVRASRGASVPRSGLAPAFSRADATSSSPRVVSDCASIHSTPPATSPDATGPGCVLPPNVTATLPSGTVIVGDGSLTLSPGAVLHCARPGCALTVALGPAATLTLRPDALPGRRDVPQRHRWRSSPPSVPALASTRTKPAIRTRPADGQAWVVPTAARVPRAPSTAPPFPRDRAGAPRTRDDELIERRSRFRARRARRRRNLGSARARRPAPPPGARAAVAWWVTCGALEFQDGGVIPAAWGKPNRTRGPRGRVRRKGDRSTPDPSTRRREGLRARANQGTI